MKERTCNYCGESVYLAERGEQLDGYETPVEHLERTGHAYNEPEIRKCLNCGNVWGFSGQNDRPTCPFCRGKRTETAEE